jgi:hypothetical protein
MLQLVRLGVSQRVREDQSPPAPSSFSKHSSPSDVRQTSTREFLCHQARIAKRAVVAGE